MSSVVDPIHVLRTILFVDDEPRIIDAIRRMLRPLRDEWQVLTASSGSEALEILSHTDVDVVISDMRMPGMDGAELLRRVKELHPKVVRIILSGQSDRESIVRSIGPTHQYLSKPCSPEALRATLARACSLQDMLRHPGLAAIISRMGSLPSLPGTYQRVIDELQSETPSLSRIADAISEDIGMSAKILQLVNFSMFRGHKPVSSPLEAAMTLGMENLRSLVLTARVFDQDSDQPDMVHLWEHGKQVGNLAKAIALAENMSKEVADLCFTAGILHDCGRLVLCSHYSDVVSREETRTRLTMTERKKFGASHPQIGAYLLGLWGLPFPLVEAIAYHHHPEAFPGTGFTPLTAVHVAEALLAERIVDPDEAATINIEYLTTIGLAGRLDAWRAIASLPIPTPST